MPIHVSIELTHHCNFHCKHCYNESSKLQNNHANKNDLIKFLNTLEHNGVQIIEITGGEPLTHPAFNEVVEHCLKTFQLVTVITNGSLIKKENIEIFSKYKDKIALQIALNGVDSLYVDEFAGLKGAFEKIKEGIELINEKGIKLILTMIVTPNNIKNVSKTVKLAKDLEQ